MTGYWILNTGNRILDTGYWILNTGYWILDTRYWILDTDTGYWTAQLIPAQPSSAQPGSAQPSSAPAQAGSSSVQPGSTQQLSCAQRPAQLQLISSPQYLLPPTCTRAANMIYIDGCRKLFRPNAIRLCSHARAPLLHDAPLTIAIPNSGWTLR